MTAVSQPTVLTGGSNFKSRTKTKCGIVSLQQHRRFTTLHLLCTILPCSSNNNFHFLGSPQQGCISATSVPSCWRQPFHFQLSHSAILNLYLPQRGHKRKLFLQAPALVSHITASRDLKSLYLISCSVPGGFPPPDGHAEIS